jgi:uncharacterized protein YxjI
MFNGVFGVTVEFCDDFRIPEEKGVEIDGDYGADFEVLDGALVAAVVVDEPGGMIMKI